MTALDDAIAKADDVLALDGEATPAPWPRSCSFVRPTWPERAQGYWRADVPAHPFPGQANEHTPSMKAQSDVNLIASYRTAAPDLARALKAVAEALEDLGRANAAGRGPLSVDNIRAAIERRLKEGK